MSHRVERTSVSPTTTLLLPSQSIAAVKAVNDAVKQYVLGENIAFADGPGASSTVIVAFTSDEVAHLLQAAGTAAEGRVSELAGQLNASREAVLGSFSILKQEQVPGAQLSGKLEEIAQRHMELVKSLAQPPEKDIPQANLDEAEELLSRAASTEDYDQVDRLLASGQSGFTIDARVKGGLVLVRRGALLQRRPRDQRPLRVEGIAIRDAYKDLSKA